MQCLGIEADDMDDIQVAARSCINEYEICSKDDVVLLNDAGRVKAAKARKSPSCASHDTGQRKDTVCSEGWLTG